jgi:predicted N-acetyltransferase YhbS
VGKQSEKLLIEHLSSTHNRTSFRCTEPALENYLHKQARQDVKRQISQAFVATATDQPSDILGYYTLSALSIELTSLPNNIAKNLPRQAIPAALLGHLTVSEKVQGTGIGKMLLMDSIKRTLAISEEIGIYALVVDALNVQVEQYYMQYGFLPLKKRSLRLYLPLKTIR